MSAALGGVLLLALGLVEGGEELALPRVAEVCPSLESLGALSRRREGAEPGLLLDSVDQTANLDPFEGFRGGPASETPALLSSWLGALGAPLGKSLFVGITIDLFGPEEVEGLRPAPVDARQSAPRLTYLSAGLDLRLKL